jgi:uncharacterized membrane protein YkoI
VRHADKAAEVQVTVAAKTSDEVKQIEAKQKQAERKGEVNAAREDREVEIQADNAKAKADNDAKRARLHADKTAQEKAKGDALDGAHESQDGRREGRPGDHPLRCEATSTPRR